MSATKAPVLGIDLGTTNTTAAWRDDRGAVRFVPISEGVYTLPTCVYFTESGTPLVGAEALKQQVQDPLNTVSGFKRFFSRRFDCEFVQRNRGRFGYELVAGRDGAAAVSVRGQLRTSEELVLHVLKRMIELASVAADRRFAECVLSVPAHFTLRQRDALREAALKLGLGVRAMVNEPTAAALCYAKERAVDETALVYDLGGGTFDATLMRIRRGIVEVIGTSGDAFLGGLDFDARLVDLLIEDFQRSHPVDLRADAVVMQRLAFAAETAKIALSTTDEVPLRVPVVATQGSEFLDLAAQVTRRSLDGQVAPLIERTLGICEELLEHVGFAPADVDEVIFTGGQTRMPAVRRRITQIFRANPTDSVQPELAVAAGAALLGHEGHLLTDVVSVPLWALTPGASPYPLVSANAFLPCVAHMPVQHRPPPGQPLIVVLYQALDATSIDRDMVGSVRVSPEWLAKNPGRLNIEVRVSTSYELLVLIDAAEGGRDRLTLTRSPKLQ